MYYDDVACDLEFEILSVLAELELVPKKLHVFFGRCEVVPARTLGLKRRGLQRNPVRRPKMRSNKDLEHFKFLRTGKCFSWGNRCRGFFSLH